MIPSLIGLHLSSEIQDQVKSIKKRMSELSIKFQRNLNEDNTKLFFTREELAGMPDDFINELAQVNQRTGWHDACALGCKCFCKNFSAIVLYFFKQ